MYIFPKPKFVEQYDKIFNTTIEKVSLGSFSYNLLRELESIFKGKLQTVSKPGVNTISFVNNLMVEKQGYLLLMKDEQIVIEASTDVGAYYAVQTLKQIFKSSPVNCVKIYDYPDLEIRGI